MKKSLFVIAGLILTFATNATDLPARDKPAGDKGGTYSVKERGADHRVMERTTSETGPDGRTVSQVHSYTELATGMHYQDDKGRWVESKEEIELLPHGAGAAATHGQHKVIFPPDLYNGQIELNTPDGKWLRSQVTGLSYFDAASGQSVLIAEVKPSAGQLAAPNVVLYPDAFTDLSADVRYTYTRAGFEQDIILRAQPPSPKEYGLDPETTRLQVLTEFHQPPAPRKRAQSLKGLADESLDFGAMKIGRGKAFALGEESRNRVQALHDSVPVGKQWLKLEGRDFLVEEVPFLKIEPKLQKLLPARVATKRKPTSPASPLHRVVAGRALPAQRLVRQGTAAFQVAKADIHSRPGYVLDYVTTYGSATEFTFRGDTTYYIEAYAGFDSTVTFEGGTVIKYGSGAYMDLDDATIVCKTAPYRPAIFTSMNDNSAGETISGSSGTPAYGDADHLMSLPNNVVLRNMRFAYAWTGFYCQNVQFRNCVFLELYQILMASEGYNIGFYNALYNQPSDASMAEEYLGWIEGCALTVENVTEVGVKRGFNLNSGGTFNHKNLLSVGVTSTNVYVDGTGWVYNTNPVFQRVGAGSYYLTNGSPYRDIGTTNIDAELLADLRRKTTYPPVVYFNTNLATTLTLGPTAARDTNGIDLGYHYDPLDYAFGACDVNSNLTFTAGTAVGWFHAWSGFHHAGHGIHIGDRQVVTFDGTAEAPTYWVRANTVQEGNANWSGGYGTGGMTSWADQGGPYSDAGSVHARYLRSTTLTSYDNAFRDDYGILIGRFRDCEFYNGGLGAYVSTYHFTNCLFFRAGSGITEGVNGNEFSAINCTWYGGNLNLTPYNATVPIVVKNCSFDRSAINIDNYAASGTYATYDYNAYTNAANPFPVGGSHDQAAVTFNWQSGRSGDFYLPSNSVAINAGSTTADALGLYHYTTRTNQLKETNSIVDIGYHYVALNAGGNPVDTDGDGAPDYLEDANGNGLNDDNTCWNPMPVITAQPYGACFTSTNVDVFDQTNIVLSVTVTGSGLTYQWKHDLDFPSDNAYRTGTHSNVLTLSSGAGNKLTANSHLGPWQCIVSNPCGFSVTSAVAQISMLPEITIQPSATKVAFIGDRVGLSIQGALGSRTNRYFQWQCSANGGVTFTNAAYIQNWPWFLTAPLYPGNNGIQYRCIVSELCGSVTSSPTVITITNFALPPTNMVSWWRGESNALDSIGTNDGALNNVAFVPGIVKTGFKFNGTNAYVEVPASSSLDVGQGDGFTIEGWVRTDVWGAIHPLFQWTDGTNKGVSLWVTAPNEECGTWGTLFADVVDGSTSHIICSSWDDIYDSSYYHVALTYDRNSGMARIYIGGYEYSSEYVGSFTAKTSHKLYLGYSPVRDGNGPFYLKGILDEVSLYNRALSAAELNAIARAENYGKMQWDILSDPQLAKPAQFTKAPFTITGAIEAEQFDKGGEGVAYHSQTDNHGTDYRYTRAAIEACDDLGLGYCLTKTKPGDWFNYSFQVRTAGVYTVEARVAGYYAGNTFRMDFYTNGVLSHQTANLSTPSTNWETVVADTQVYLAPGTNWMRLCLVTNAGGTNFVGRFNYLVAYPTITMSPIPTNTVLVTGLIEGVAGLAINIAQLNSSNIQRTVESQRLTGGTIVFPAGTYYLAQNPIHEYNSWVTNAWEPHGNNTAVMVLTNNTRLMGDPTGTNTILKAHNRMLQMLVARNLTNLTFENLILAHSPHSRFIPGQTNTVYEAGSVFKNDPGGPYLMAFASVTNVNIHHCVFKNAGAHHIFLGVSDHILIQSNSFLSYVDGYPDGDGFGVETIDDPWTVSAGEMGPGASIHGQFFNYVVTSNYYNGNVAMTNLPPGATYTNKSDGFLWNAPYGGNGYLADNVIVHYYLEAILYGSGPAATVRNQFDTYRDWHFSSCALAVSDNNYDASLTQSLDDLAYAFIGNVVHGGSSGLRGNGSGDAGHGMSPCSYTWCGNVIDVDNGMLDLTSCQFLNCSGNTIEHSRDGIQSYPLKAYTEAEIFKNDFRGITDTTIENPGGGAAGGLQNMLVFKNQLGMGVTNGAHLRLPVEDSSAFYFLQNQYYDGAQNPTNHLVTDPANAPVHVW